MRTFVAIDVNSEIREIAQEVMEKLQNAGFKANWTKPENLHLTLFFMGEMDERHVDKMADVLNKRLLGFPSFSTVLAGIGYFKFKHAPRVIFLKLEPTKSLQKMYLEMKSELTKNKFKYDDQGNFVPHVTLARVKEYPSNWETIVSEMVVPKITLVIDGFTIYSSTLTPQGPIYKWVYKSKFEGGLEKNVR
uniref:RNA 2',3'-cyclic phosphodiesterase n=1 Tax=Fervidobacterium thailandense TaxID=1008305 RepID=A0A7C4VSZ1_9BACT